MSDREKREPKQTPIPSAESMVARAMIPELVRFDEVAPNPLYLWEAIYLALKHELPIPQACLDYLARVSAEISTLNSFVLTGTNQQPTDAKNWKTNDRSQASEKSARVQTATRRLLSVFGLDGKGKANPFWRLRSDNEHRRDFRAREAAAPREDVPDEAKHLYPTAREALNAIARQQGNNPDERTVRGRVARGRKFFPD